MKLSKFTVLIITAAFATATFINGRDINPIRSSSVIVKGYLDDLSKDLYKKADQPDLQKDSVEANRMDKEQIDRYGPGNFEDFVDFDEFDGGDGQMGVAGDGKQGLDKGDFNTGALAKNLKKSKSMSAKNAWGTSTGYAEKLMKERPGIDISRAQQLENWHQQREINKDKKQLQYYTDEFDKVKKNAELDWRSLAQFGVERNEDFVLEEVFGSVTTGDKIEGTIELHARVNGLAIYEFSLRNDFMGFADFRAAFTDETPSDWKIEPEEGSLQSSKQTDFIVKFRPQGPGVSEGFLVIETEDFKKTWKVFGNTA